MILTTWLVGSCLLGKIVIEALQNAVQVESTLHSSLALTPMVEIKDQEKRFQAKRRSRAKNTNRLKGPNKWGMDQINTEQLRRKTGGPFPGQ